MYCVLLLCVVCVCSFSVGCVFCVVCRLILFVVHRLLVVDYCLFVDRVLCVVCCVFRVGY